MRGWTNVILALVMTSAMASAAIAATQKPVGSVGGPAKRTGVITGKPQAKPGVKAR